MASFTAVYDACVLHPAPLRDLLLRVALADLFRARWTEQIHAEWIRSVLERRADLKPEQLARTRELMDASIPAHAGLAVMLGAHRIGPSRWASQV